MGYRGAYHWAAIWIVFCVWCQTVPWLLSLFGQLNRWGYLVAILLSLPPALIWGRKLFSNEKLFQLGILKRWGRRMRRQPVFGIWLVIFLGAVIGGVLYPPTNHDGLTYRFPRVLHWMWEGNWHWISNPPEPQMNLSTHGFEWLTALFFTLTGTDRLFFLINLVSMALLPGLLFACLTRVGISGRVASWWMWIFPCGYGIALQAGSIGNDLFAIPYVLAGVVFALRARDSKNIGDVVLAILSAALVTGTKLSNAPLVLPIAAALAGNLFWVCRWRYVPAMLGATSVGLVASAAPLIIACQIYTGHFSGDPENSKSLNVENPVAGLVANSLQVVSRNLMPPVNPAANWWNGRYETWLPGSLKSFLGANYPRFHLNWSELPQEENDGLGLGLVILVIIALGAGAVSLFRGGIRWLPFRQWDSGKWVRAATAAATFVYFVKMGSEAAPRLMLPYYAILLTLVLAFDLNRRLVRRRWWQLSATAAAAFVLPALVLSPNRPLVPVRAILANLPDSVAESGSVVRVATVYETYAVRNDAMASLRKWLPASASDGNRIAFVGDGRSLRTGLWRPFGMRKVESLSESSSPEEFQKSGYGAAVVDLARIETGGAEKWAAERGLRVVTTESVRNYAGKPPERFAVLVPVETDLAEGVPEIRREGETVTLVVRF